MVTYNPLVRDGVSFASAWQVSSLTAIFTTSVLVSPSLPSWLWSVKAQLKRSHQLCHDILACAELVGRIEVLPSTAGLWVNAIVTLRDGETMQDILAYARRKHVIVDASHDFARFLGKNQGQIKITFSLEEGVLREGLLRLKAALV